ncbi:DUF6350 family protein [uncultured Microbacterium sp.]|uniref:cell division protein PerM n=1 Tax=uncultured Microbacterium sp. TaxID=191216 RepID=UPI0028D533A8|nr:DUF6350 family protein [uncultured Microbacterium sp.]
MHRLIVVILSAVDAAIAAAVGIAATLAPLTLLWVLGLGGTADWGALWPASATVWQFGHLVPLRVTLPGDYVAVAGIDPGAASFVLSLAPLAFAAFTAIFAARSGVRASQADAWSTGVITGSLVFAALTALIALSSGNDLAAVERWQAILLPALVFTVPLLLGAVVTEWREAGAGWVARVRDRIEAAPRGWGEVPGLIVRGTAVALTGSIGLGALAFAFSLLPRGGEVIALYEAAHVDVLGATVITLAQLAYLPTLVIWGMAFVAGPGFAVGADTAVSPAGTQLGVIPGVPVLGALPESSTPWLLLLALLPVALGALAGWIARSQLAAVHTTAAHPSAVPTNAVPTGTVPITTVPSAQPTRWDAAPDAARSSALSALLAGAEPSPASPAGQVAATDATHADARSEDSGEHLGPRAVIALGIATLAGAGAGALSVLASGSMGPGRLGEVGPHAGAVALAVGVEILVGAAIVLLSPGRRPKPVRADAESAAVDGPEDEAVPDAVVAVAVPRAEPRDPEPQPAPQPAASPAPRRGDPDTTSTVDLGPRRPQPLPSPRTPPVPPVD